MKALCKPIKTQLQTVRRRDATGNKKFSRAQKISKSRVFKYLSLWDDIFKKWNWSDKSENEKSELRHGINEDLFGKYTAPSKLTNEQFSVMRYALEMLLENGILVWSKEMAACAVDEGLRRIYTWWIKHAGLDIEGVIEYGAPDEYIAAIARDRFGVSDWRVLSSQKLQQLFWTIKNRVRSAQARGVSLFTNAEESGTTGEDCPF